MCEFCTSHGEGAKWYENASNYTRRVFESVNSEAGLREFLSGLGSAMRVKIPLAAALRRRMPRVYDMLIAPRVTRHLKKAHFGQVLPIEDVLPVLGTFTSVVRLPCVCRSVTLRREVRACYGIGVDFRHIYGDLPDYRNLELVPSGQAAEHITKLDREGKVHSVWTFMTPYIGAICNCDSDCMAYRFQHRLGLGQAMFRAEYIAAVDMAACSGCGECVGACHFGALGMSPRTGKCEVAVHECYGCGVCRNACGFGAIELGTRNLSSAANIW